jgi:transglutaminase-like putative cysteine protease
MIGNGNWRLRITHRTWFQYDGTVATSYNEARMSPRSESRQAVLDSRVEVTPSAKAFRYEDYWGTTVTAFDLTRPHDSLTVKASALVETTAAPPAGDGPEWEAMEPLDRWHELMLPTPHTALDEELTALAAQVKAEHGTPQEAALAVCQLIRETVEYLPGSTGVQTDAVHAWRQRSGVCQDISHLVVGLLRSMGIPAGYVSGYLHPNAEAKIGEEVAGQSHAWVEWWTDRWVGYDPTNGVPIGPHHVAVGRGREYGDVPPLKGIYSGPGNTAQGVEVLLTRLR